MSATSIVSPRRHPQGHDRLTQADDHEQAVALGEVADRDLLQSAQLLARQPGGTRVIDRDREQPQDHAPGAVQERPRDQQRHPDRDRDREACDRRPRGVALPRRVGVQRKM
jgi:hypothetical protein